MKKILYVFLLLAIFVGAVAHAETASASKSCIPFEKPLYYGISTWVKTAGYYDRDIGKDIEKTDQQVSRLQSLLEKEGFSIDSSEKNRSQFLKTTAYAVSRLQDKYKADLLTSQGLALPYGVLDERGVAFLNGKYPCVKQPISESVVRFAQQGTTVTLKTGTLLNAKYVVTKVDGTAKTVFSYLNHSTNVETVVKEYQDKNGRHNLDSIVPAPGVYTVKGKVDGSSKISQFTLISTENVTTSNSSNSEGSNTENNTGSELDTDGVSNIYKANIILPGSASSIKAGAYFIVRGSVEKIPNNAKVAVYLVASNGTETLLRNGGVYACTTDNICTGFKASPLGMRIMMPSGTSAGTYRIKVVVQATASISVNDYSDSFTVTN